MPYGLTCRERNMLVMNAFPVDAHVILSQRMGIGKMKTLQIGKNVWGKMGENTHAANG
jgi:hypothetical protein